MRTYLRSYVEKLAFEQGLELAEAGTQVRYEALEKRERLPRWQLSDGKHSESVRGYATLAEVVDALEEREITRS